MIPVFLFYVFSFMVIASALAVITARNPVHSVLFLILAFFNASGLFVLMGAEFIALILVIVYVGAVAVLFLFVVMMLDISFADLRRDAMQYVPLGLILGIIMLAQLIMLYVGWNDRAVVSASALLVTPVASPAVIDGLTNTEILGRVLYTDYVLPFQIAGLVLFVAMIGAIVLTHRRRPGVRRQNVSDQNARKPDDVMHLETPERGKGITL